MNFVAMSGVFFKHSAYFYEVFYQLELLEGYILGGFDLDQDAMRVRTNIQMMLKNYPEDDPEDAHYEVALLCRLYTRMRKRALKNRTGPKPPQEARPGFTIKGEKHE